MFYTFNQNNSGGSFDHDDSAGIGFQVCVEASSSQEANDIAIGIGLYFDGCSKEIDCDCCGDRWYKVNEYDAEEKPSSYGGPIEGGWGIPSYIHYKDGTINKVEELSMKQRLSSE